MIKIYFDNNLIDTDSYTNLENEYELFANEFTLGSVASNYFHLSVDKTKVNSIPNLIKIMEEDTPIAVLHVDSVVEDKYTYDFELTDALTLMEKPYDASPLIAASENGYVTLLELVKDICQKYNIELGVTDFLGADKHISWYNNEIHARTYISYVAELNGGYATIKGDGKLYFERHNKNSSHSVNIDDCDDFQVGEYHKITRVVYDTGVVTWIYGNNVGDTIYLDTSNTFITCEEDVENIYNLINNFEFYTFEVGNCPINILVHAGDVITFADNNCSYPTIANYSISYFGDWSGNYKLDVLTNIKKETQAQSLDKKVKKISSRLDYDEGKLEIIGEEIGDRTSKTTSITQDLDSISESVSLQQNLTNIVKETSYVDVDDAYEGNLLYLSIHGQMSLVYPSNDLYPENTLYPLDSYLIIEYSDNIKEKIKLPINWLNYIDNNTYDEFVLEENNAKIIRRVGENEDGSFYKLENEVIEDYGELIIPLKTGYNKLWLESFYDLELNYKIKYVIKSDYTDTFATEVYVDNSIDISEKGVLLQSKQYTDNKAEDLSSEIQLHAGEIVLKVDANGKIVKAALTADAEQGTLFEIDADQVNLTANDILNLIAGNEINLTSKNLSINSTNFSVDKDGKVQAKDMTILGGDINLHSQELLSKIKITDTDNEDCYFTMNARVWNWFGANGGTINFTNTLSIPIISLSDKEESDTQITSQWVKTPIVNQTSLKEHKKNFEKYAGALEEIKNIDVYKYNLKSEEDGSKKHLGFVIGDGFNYSKTVTSQDNTGVDIYSMTSLCLQAIKEQQEEIEKLKEEINSLKKGGK